MSRLFEMTTADDPVRQSFEAYMATEFYQAAAWRIGEGADDALWVAFSEGWSRACALGKQN